MKNKEDVKNWDTITIVILFISLFTIAFSFAAPFIFTNDEYINFDFSNTGQIGDTIGGLLNPFIALAGVFLTFLAFYMQIKANQIQIRQFKEGVQLRKDKEDRDEKKDYFNKLSLLKVDLEAIALDIEIRSSKIKEYYEHKYLNPFKPSPLVKTPSKEYMRVLEIDRLSVYNAFATFLSHGKNWITDFSNLHNTLDYLPVFFEDIYDKHDSHSKEIFNKKIKIKDDLSKLMDKLDIITNYTKNEYCKEISLASKTISNYYKIIEKSLILGDFSKKTISETDFLSIDKLVLEPFLEEAMQIKQESNCYAKMESIIEFVSNIRKQIYTIKQKTQEFALEMKKQYKRLMSEDDKSYISSLKKIICTLDTELKKVELE